MNAAARTDVTEALVARVDFGGVTLFTPDGEHFERSRAAR